MLPIRVCNNYHFIIISPYHHQSIISTIQTKLICYIVTGTVSFSHVVGDEVIFSTSARLSSLEGILLLLISSNIIYLISLSVTKFAFCGGMELVVLRDGPLIGEGDYITTVCIL